jgi:hypothetical protein
MVSMNLVAAAAALGMNKFAAEAGEMTGWVMGNGHWLEKNVGEVQIVSLKKERPLWDL